MEQRRRIVLKHLKGSKAGTEESFALADSPELVIGRDPSALIRFDAEKDDLVGRRHARIAADATDPERFVVTDLGSRNGTFVNRQRISGSTCLSPGDLLQFGPGGPELLFDLDPRPEKGVPATREVSGLFADLSAAPPTREVAAEHAPSAASNASAPASAARAQSADARSVGKQTVERLIAAQVARTKSDTRSRLIFGGLALVALVALVAGGLVYQNRHVAAALSRAAKESEAQNRGLIEDVRKKQAAMVAPGWAALTERYNEAVVKIEVGWHLVDSLGKGALYHQVMKAPETPGQPDRYLPAFIELIDGNKKSLEPYISTDPKDERGQDNIPIGGNHSGSGFVAHKDGYILTNRHVAATWMQPYEWPDDPRYHKGGMVLVLEKDPVQGLVKRGLRFISPADFPTDWTPNNSQLQDGKLLEGKVVEGAFEYLDVAFANDRLRRRARLVLPSDRHDVALIKVDVAGRELTAVELSGDREQVRKQDPVLVMGYPAVTPRRAEVTESAQGFGSRPGVAIVADPTATSGAIQNILNDRAAAGQTVFSEVGDVYQLQINATGSGNSGGPVFDAAGRVIGIFYAGRAHGGAAVTFAVPIRYGIELLGGPDPAAQQ
jgi:serine protease Do